MARKKKKFAQERLRTAMAIKIFLHGLESSSRGTKAVFFREKYPEMLTPDFTGPLEERLALLEKVLSAKTGIRMVGSSFGGLMGTLFAMQDESRVDRLILLAPAIHMLSSLSFPLKELSIPVRVYHGTNDQVIPIERVRETAKTFFRNLIFQTVEDDHFLHRTFQSIDWDELLVE
jgi:pimeloyl-ACP methyl ester carboxylesterase